MDFIRETLTRENGGQDVADAEGGTWRLSIISINGDVEWAPRSPDLTPLDFWLWGVLKHKCFQTPPENGTDLHIRILDECERIEREESHVFELVR